VVKVYVISQYFTIASRILSVPSPTGGDHNNRPPLHQESAQSPGEGLQIQVTSMAISLSPSIDFQQPHAMISTRSQ
jgi:hypothetical protein